MFATVPGSSINSWDSWFIFNLRKINTCYCTDTLTHGKQTMIIGHREYICSKSADISVWTNTLNNVHTWTSVFLRHLASTSFMVPFWPYTELGCVPILVSAHLEDTLIQRMLFIALMTAAQVSPNVFLPCGWLLTNVQANITL